MAWHKITCRYGVEYKIMAYGEKGAQARLEELLSRCCCWVCHNRDCEHPRNEIVHDCKEVCSLYTKTPYCRNK